MSKVSIFYKSSTPFIEALLKEDSVEEYKNRTLFERLKQKAKIYPTVYFFEGKLNDQSLENFTNTKLIVVSSISKKNEIIKRYGIKTEKIEVFYPTFSPLIIDEQEQKSIFFTKYDLCEDTKLIFISSNNLKNAGIDYFFKTISRLNYQKYKVVIASKSEQINNLKFQFSKYIAENIVILLEDIESIDTILAISDIFLLPTTLKSFQVDILKAMYYKNVVFVPAQNSSSEIIDIFSTINSPNDTTTSFKIDAILNNQEELDKIKEQNKKIAKELLLQKELDRFKLLLKAL